MQAKPDVTCHLRTDLLHGLVVCHQSHGDTAKVESTTGGPSVRHTIRRKKPLRLIPTASLELVIFFFKFDLDVSEEILAVSCLWARNFRWELDSLRTQLLGNEAGPACNVQHCRSICYMNVVPVKYTSSARVLQSSCKYVCTLHATAHVMHM